MYTYIKQLLCFHKYVYEEVKGNDPIYYHSVLTCSKCKKQVIRFS